MAAITCTICPKHCRIGDGRVGFCGVRQNVEGENKDSTYQRLYEPVTLPQSVEAPFPGCNIRCFFCGLPAWSKPRDLSGLREIPENLLVEFTVATAHRRILSFFGGEPTLHFEYLSKAAKLAHRVGLQTMVFTNGYISPEFAEFIGSFVDGVSVGDKGSASPRVYKKLGADVNVVLENIKIFAKRTHLEISNLVGPSVESTDAEDSAFGEWLVSNVGSDVSVHLEPESYPYPPYGNFDLKAGVPYVGGVATANYTVTRVSYNLRGNGLRNVWSVVSTIHCLDKMDQLLVFRSQFV